MVSFALSTVVAIAALTSKSASEPQAIVGGLLAPFGAAFGGAAGAALGLLGGGLALGATALAAANVSNRSLRRFGQRRFEYHGYYGYGKRSVDGYGDLEELEAIQEKVAEMFHRASQMDGEQCVRRLICEVNAEHGSSESSLEISAMDRIILDTFGGGNNDNASSSPYPEFDSAARIGKAGTVDGCQKIFNRCSLTSQELKSKAMYSKRVTPLKALKQRT